MDGLLNTEHYINKLDIESLLHVKEACPNLAGNAFLNDKKLKSSIATLENAFNNLEEYVDGRDFEGIRQSIDMIMEGTSNVDALVTQVEMNDWIVKMFVLFLNVLVCFMIITTLVSLSGRYLEPLKVITMMLVFPAFVVFISSSWIAAAFISFLAISNAGMATCFSSNNCYVSSHLTFVVRSLLCTLQISATDQKIAVPTKQSIVF
jgi:hypothetical protein